MHKLALRHKGKPWVQKKGLKWDVLAIFDYNWHEYEAFKI